MDARDILLAHAQSAASALAGFPALSETLDAMLAQARRTWPSVDVQDQVFVRHLAGKLAHEQDPIAALANTHAADLYLACACAAGNPQAMRAFEEHLMPGIESFLRRENALRDLPDEIKQTLRVRLLTADGEHEPRIAQYSGQGPLAGWLRTIAVRAAIDAHRRDPNKNVDSNPFNRLASSDQDPEFRYLQSHYRVEFEAVFKIILGQLSEREANLLAMYYLDGVSLEALGTLYGVSHRTVRRWIERVNKNILRETLKRLRERLEISTTDLGSIIALVESQLNLSISRYLRAHRDR